MLWVADNNTFCSRATATDLWSAPLTCAKLWAHKSFVTTATWLALWNPCKNRISVSSTLKDEAYIPQQSTKHSTDLIKNKGFFSTAKLIAGLNFNEKQFGYEMNKWISYPTKGEKLVLISAVYSPWNTTVHTLSTQACIITQVPKHTQYWIITLTFSLQRP